MYNIFYICVSIIPILLTIESQVLYFLKPEIKFYIIKNIFNSVLISLLITYNIYTQFYIELTIPVLCILYHFILTYKNYKKKNYEAFSSRIIFDNENDIYDADIYDFHDNL